MAAVDGHAPDAGKSKDTDLNWRPCGGVMLSRKSATRLLVRSGAIALLFCAGLVWQLIPDGTAGPRLRGASWAAVKSHRDAAPRRLSPPDAQSSEVEINLMMVDKSHLTTQGCPTREGVCIKDGRKGLLVLYIAGVIYMFVALAIVCDEFFVPSLEVFVAEFDVSPDVAGATFMAAGGSMPELFTSFVGTFQRSDIGFATIVGSAVFNVLFVIGVCAVVSKEALKLTWWPLARDCTCYIVGLLTLAFFFLVSSRQQIEWWEASVLLLEYIAYCVLMKHNEQVHLFITNLLGTRVEMVDAKVADGEKSEEVTNKFFRQPSAFRRGIVQLITQNARTAEIAGVAAVTSVEGNLKGTFNSIDVDKSGSIELHELARFLRTLGYVDSVHIAATAAGISRRSDCRIDFEDFQRWYLASEARVMIEVHPVFQILDKDASGLVDVDEISQIMQGLGHHLSDDELVQIMAEISGLQDETSTQSTRASGPPLVDKDSCFLQMPFEASRAEACKVEKSEKEAIPISAIEASTRVASGVIEASTGLGPEAVTIGGSEASIRPVLVQQIKDGPASLTFQQFSSWYRLSLFWQEQQEQCEAEEKGGRDGFSIEVPEDSSLSTLLWYFFTYPICVALYATMPDVRRTKCQGSVFVAVVQFVLSMMWMALFSVCMVDWATVASNTAGIPAAVAGVTVIAAGTSVPDMISSYIVARNGQGDMAVSSSIGSNIFDILVGLPLPWLLFNLTHGEAVRVKTTSLGFSILVLVAMLAAVVSTIIFMRWRMTKQMGYVMLFLYAMFMAQSILQQLPEDRPVIGPINF